MTTPSFKRTTSVSFVRSRTPTTPLRRTSRTSSSLRERTSRTRVRSTRTRRSPRRGAARSRSLGFRTKTKTKTKTKRSRSTRTRTFVARRRAGCFAVRAASFARSPSGWTTATCASSASYRRRAEEGRLERLESHTRAVENRRWKTASSAATIVTSLSSRVPPTARAASGRRRLRPSSAACWSPEAPTGRFRSGIFH